MQRGCCLLFRSHIDHNAHRPGFDAPGVGRGDGDLALELALRQSEAAALRTVSEDACRPALQLNAVDAVDQRANAAPLILNTYLPTTSPSVVT